MGPDVNSYIHTYLHHYVILVLLVYFGGQSFLSVRFFEVVVLSESAMK